MKSADAGPTVFADTSSTIYAGLFGACRHMCIRPSFTLSQWLRALFTRNKKIAVILQEASVQLYFSQKRLSQTVHKLLNDTVSRNRSNASDERLSDRAFDCSAGLGCNR